MPRLQPLNAMFAISALGFTSMYLLFAVTPVEADALGGSVGAGLSTTVFMLFTIGTQVCTPPLMRRVRAHLLVGAALLLLGLPSVIYVWDPDMTQILVSCALRGIGFGLFTVLGVALVTLYARTGAEGAALGFYGLSTSVTGIIGPPLGLVLLDWWHPSPGLLAIIAPCAALGLLGILATASPAPITQGHHESGHERGSLKPMLLTLLIFIIATTAYGATYTFVPLGWTVAAAALLFFGLGFAAGRLIGGRLVDRIDAVRVMVPSAAIGALGMLGAALWPDAALGFVGALGAGFGIGSIASASLAGLMKRATPRDLGLVSTAWNFTFDLGIAIGGLGLGVVVTARGYQGAFLLLTGLMAVAFMLSIVSVLRKRTSSTGASS